MVKVNCDFAENFVWWPHSSRLPALNAPFGASILCCSYFWCKDTTLVLRFTNTLARNRKKYGEGNFSRVVQSAALLQCCSSRKGVYILEKYFYIYINIELNFDIYSSCFYNCNAATLQHESYQLYCTSLEKVLGRAKRQESRAEWFLT